MGKDRDGGGRPLRRRLQDPEGQAPGAYKLYVHNGHGGAYGFGGPVELVVEASRWTRDAGEVAVKPSGGDDAPEIQKAIDAAAMPVRSGRPSESLSVSLSRGSWARFMTVSAATRYW